MRKLPWYILREHFGPFVFAFCIITFLLVIDYVPRIIDHVIDKDLSVWVVLELIGLNLAWMLALSVPMSVLVSTLMAFGRLSGDWEITAMKSCGVNMVSILLPLLLAGSVITFGMVQFNDKVLPDLNKMARQLWGDISAMRPTLIFRSGVFISDIPGYLVLIDNIDHATSRVDGVHITDQRNPTNPRVIIAEYGYLKTTDGGRNMQFDLYNGEVHQLDIAEPSEYRKVSFENQVINISRTGSELIRSDSEYRTDREMPIAQMQENVDRASNTVMALREKVRGNVGANVNGLFADSVDLAALSEMTLHEALAKVKNDANGMARFVGRNEQQIVSQRKVMNKYNIEIYKKYSIPAASLAFILIGAPLGILSKRGGMGVAIAISILLFIVYWAFLIGGEDVADRGLASPFLAMWSANILIGAIGLYLNYIVITEKPIFAWIRGIR